MIKNREEQKMVMKTKCMGIFMFVAFCILAGCSDKSQQVPDVSANDTLKQYLHAMKEQDGLAMAEWSVDHTSFDFTVSDTDAQEIGLNKEIVQAFHQQLLTFTYASDPEKVADDRAEITIHVSAYDINQIVNDTVEEHKDEFGEINAEDISEEEKNSKIADILVKAFKDKDKTYTFTMTFHLRLVENVWLVENADALTFVDMLFQQKQEAS